MKIGSWIAESMSILNTSKNRYVFIFNFEVLFSSEESAILSFDVNAPQLTSCVTLCVNKSSRHFTRIKWLPSIIVSKLECHILTKGRIHKNRYPIYIYVITWFWQQWLIYLFHIFFYALCWRVGHRPLSKRRIYTKLQSHDFCHYIHSQWRPKHLSDCYASHNNDIARILNAWHCGGYIGITPSVCLSVRLSVCPEQT